MKRTREQIDSLERLLQVGMPGKCVIENARSSVSERRSISDELDEQWRRGLSHGQLTYSPQEMITGPYSPTDIAPMVHLSVDSHHVVGLFNDQRVWDP